MKKVAAFSVLFLALIVLALQWIQPTPAPPPPPVKISPRPRAPQARIYNLPPPVELPPTPIPPPSQAEKPLLPESFEAFRTASSEAMGDGWQECMEPWIYANEDPEAMAQPIILNLDIVDGRLSEVRLQSPVELPQTVVTCFADTVWKTEFPEDPQHTGRSTIQRVMKIRK